MSKKPTYQELEQKVKELEKEAVRRKKAENELRISEEKFKKIFDNANIIIWGTYADGRIRVFNKVAERVMGYSQEEALGMMNMSLHPPEEREEILEKFKNHVGGMLKRDLELGIYTKDGKRLRVLLAQATFKDTEGEDFYVALMQDITKRKQAEENLRFLSSMVEQSSEGMAIASLDGELLFVNQAWARMHGYECADKLIGKDLSIFHSQEQFEKDVKPFNNMVLKKGFNMGEVGHMCNDGTSFPTLMTTTLLKDTKEKPVAFAGIAMDITERKRMEEELRYAHDALETRVQKRTIELAKANKELRESEAKWRSMAENSPDIITILDRKFNIQFINKLPTKTREDVIGYSIFEFVSKKYKPSMKACFERVIKTGKADQYETAHAKSDGTIINFETRVGPIIHSGEVHTLILSSTDITERKKAEEKIHSYQKQLRSLASELSLTEERERRHIATNLHDSIGQKLAISKIKLGLLQESASSENLAENLKQIRQLIEESIKSTRSLMFELSPPMLYELGFESAVEWLTEQAEKQHGILCSLEVDKSSKPISDEIRTFLFQAVRELITNIVKHGQTDKVKISICKDGNNIRIDIKDNGVGFDVSKTSSYEKEERGFGLFNIRERLDYLGGHFEIKSEPGKGTNATLMAPLKIVEDIQEDYVL